MKTKLNDISHILLYVTPVLFWQLYWYIGFDSNTVKLVLFIFSIFLFFFVFKEILCQDRDYFRKAFRVFLIVYFLSYISAFLIWDQSPLLTYRAGVFSLVVLYYFLLKKVSIPINIKKIVSFFSIIYVLLWLFALSKAPETVFGNLDDVTDERGFYRILQLPSIEMVALMYFLCLNDVLHNRKIIFNSVVSLILFIVIVLSMSRTLIVGIILATLYYFLRLKKIKLIILIVILVSSSSAVLSQNEVVMGMIDMTKDQFENKSENDLRLVEYQHAIQAYNTNALSFFIGNGDGHVSSPLGARDKFLHDSIGFDKADSGYVSIYCSYGIIGLLILLSVCFRCLKLRDHIENLPYQCFIIVLLIVSFTSNAFIQYGIPFMISVYMIGYNRRVLR